MNVAIGTVVAIHIVLNVAIPQFRNLSIRQD